MRRTHSLLASAAFAFALLAPAEAISQAPPTPPTPVAPRTEQLDSKACGPGGTHATVGQGGDVVVRKPNDQSLSTKLAQSDGVICPPGQIDPEIRAPAPQGGAMQVIPPPGSSGGDQSVQPK